MSSGGGSGPCFKAGSADSRGMKGQMGGLAWQAMPDRVHAACTVRRVQPCRRTRLPDPRSDDVTIVSWLVTAPKRQIDPTQQRLSCCHCTAPFCVVTSRSGPHAHACCTPYSPSPFVPCFLCSQPP